MKLWFILTIISLVICAIGGGAKLFNKNELGELALTIGTAGLGIYGMMFVLCIVG